LKRFLVSFPILPPCILSAFSEVPQNYIPVEYRPLVKPAEETRGALREAYVAKAAIHVKRVEVVFESRAHIVLRFTSARKSRRQKSNTEHSLFDKLPAAENGKADKSNPEQQHCRRFRDGTVSLAAAVTGNVTKAITARDKKYFFIWPSLFPFRIRKHPFKVFGVSGDPLRLTDSVWLRAKHGCQFGNGVTVNTQFS
jgi:hypothetical protein